MNINTAELGMTVQKLICDKYNIDIDSHTESQFISSFRNNYKKEIEPIIEKLFKE